MIWLLLFLPTAKALTKCYHASADMTAADIGISSSDYQSLSCQAHQFCRPGTDKTNFPAQWGDNGGTAIKRFQSDDSNCNYMTNTGPCDSSVQIDDSSFSSGTGLTSTYTGGGDMIAAAKVSCGKHPECFYFQKYASNAIHFMNMPLETPETDTCAEYGCTYRMKKGGLSTDTFYKYGNPANGVEDNFVWSICVDRPTCTEANSGPFRNMWFKSIDLIGTNSLGQMCDLELTAVEASKTDFVCTDYCTATECCGDPLGKTCSSWEDCGLTHDCVDGTCQKIIYKCSSDADCMTGDKCVDDGSSAFTRYDQEAYFPMRVHRQHAGLSNTGTFYVNLQTNYKGEPYAIGQTNNNLFPSIPLGSDWELATGPNKDYLWTAYNYGTPGRDWYALKTDASDFDDFVSKAEAKCDEIDCTFFIVMGAELYNMHELQALFSIGVMDPMQKQSYGYAAPTANYAWRTFERTNKVCKEGGFIPNTKAELLTARDACLAENSTGACPTFEASTVPAGQGGGAYGPIGTWKTRKIDNMQDIFKNKGYFNQPLQWDTGNVIYFNNMFKGAAAFNQPLTLNLKKATMLEYMFEGATAFDQDLSSWDLSSVTNMVGMFSTSGFKQIDSIKNWDTSSVKSLSSVFSNTCLEAGKLEWNTASVTSMYGFLSRSSYNANCKQPNISSFDMSSVTEISNMFYGQNVNGSLTLDVPVLANSIFKNAHVSGTVILKGITNLGHAFSGATIYGDIGLDQWDTSSVTYIGYAFANAEGDFSGINNWDISAVAYNGWYNTFENSMRLAPCWNWPGGAINAFTGSNIYHKICTSTDLGADVQTDSTCTDLCKDRGEACSADEDCYDRTCINNVCSEYTLAGPCGSSDDCNSPERCLNGVCKLGFKPTTKSYLIDAIEGCLGTGQSNNFNGHSGINCDLGNVPAGQGSGPYGPMGEWDVSLITDFSSLFRDNSYYSSSGLRSKSFKADISQWETSQVTNMYRMFEKAQQFNQPLTNWDTSSVTQMDKMFYEAMVFNQPLNWDTSSVTDMRWMFYNAYAMNSPIDFDTSSVNNMESMFAQATNFNQPLWKFDTSQVTDMEKMFQYSGFNQDIKNWDTSKVIKMGDMFYSGAMAHDISCWDISSVTSVSSMFKSMNPSYPHSLCWDLTGKNSNYFSASTQSCTPTHCKNEGEACSAADECFSEYCSTNCLPITLGEACPPAQCNGDEVCDYDVCVRPTLGESCTQDSDCISVEICPSQVCLTATCNANEFVEATICKPCPAGTTNAAGDLITVDSQCDPTLCGTDERVQGNACVACPPGTTKPAGDDASQGDTSCTVIVCTENHRVKNNVCEQCADGFLRLAGDKADGADTECFDASTCGGLTCDATGSSSCVNHKCVCNPLFGGPDCSKDRSPAARLQKLRLSRKKALPTRENLKQRQKEVKDLAREILQEEIAKGLSTKLAVKNSRIEVEVQDIQREAQVVVAKAGKTPVIAVAPENKDVADTCDQGPACATLDIAEEGGEMTFLDTAEEAGSWTAMANGDNIVSKQTKVSEGVYDMQCWNNTWGTATRLDTTAGGKLYECNGHIILVGSQACICTPTTCQNGGTCTTDGLAFSCDCAEGFTGDFCETTATMTHCHQIDCSDFGGHKAGECTDCNVGNCCNYATRALFDTHCDTLSSTQDYVNAKCCHRTYCI